MDQFITTPEKMREDLAKCFKQTHSQTISVPFAIKEIPVDKRRTVAQQYRPQDYTPKFAKYVCVAIIVHSGDHLMVPPEYGQFRFTSEPQGIPAATLNALDRVLAETYTAKLIGDLNGT